MCAIVAELIVKDRVGCGWWLEEQGYLAVGIPYGVEYFEWFWEVGLGEATREVYVHVKEAEGSARLDENPVCPSAIVGSVYEVTGFS